MLKRTLLAVAALALLLGVPAAADQITGGRPAEYTVNVKTLGARGDAQSFGAASGTSPGDAGNTATMTAGSAILTAPAATTFTAGDIGKAITVDGAGAAAGPLSTTIAGFTDAQHVTLAATASTSTPAFRLANCTVTTDQAGGGSYAPNDTATLTGGSGTQAVCTVKATQVHSATVNAAGSGGTTGACILTGTTGTSASGLGLFQINATITAGAVSALGSFITQGIYTTNPTLISAEPVTSNCGVTGVTLTLVMGIKYAYPSGLGLYAPLPAEPISQGSTSGAGTGATFAPKTFATGTFYYGTDDSAAFAAAVTKMNSVMATGTPAILEVPPGNYLIRSTPVPIFAGPGGIAGDGPSRSVMLIDAGYSGDLFSWTDTCYCLTAFNGNTTTLTPLSIGASVSGLSVVGDRSAAAQQNAFMFYDRNDFVLFQDVNINYVPGAGIQAGALKNQTVSWLREANFNRVRIFNSGLPNVAAFEIESLGSSTEGSNSDQLADVNIFGAAGTSLWIHAAGAAAVHHIGITNLRIEGLGLYSGFTGDLLALGDTTGSGNLNDIQVTNAFLFDPYLGGAALHVMQPSGPAGQTFGITVQAAMDGGGSPLGRGLWLSGGRQSSYVFSGIGTNDYNVVIDSTTFVGAANQIVNVGHLAFTSSVDATSAQNQTAWLNPLGTGAVRAGLSGNNRGSHAVDLQTDIIQLTSVASGVDATVSGGFNNTASGAQSTAAGGQSNAATSSSSTVSGGLGNSVSGPVGMIPGGQRATDRGNYNSACWASGMFVFQGDAQTCDYLLRGTTSNTVAVTLTGDGLSAGAANCVNIPGATGYLLSVDIMAFDHTTPANNESWQGYAVKLHRPVAANTTAVVLGTKPTPLTSGTVTGSDVSITADTTNGCVNILFTPPTGNSDTWRAVAKVRTIQVQ